MRPPRFLLFVAFVFFVDVLPVARAGEPFFKKGDVIAIVGGEDMVAMSEYGYLELLLTRALPDYHLRFRNLAWEGDTVFEQRRDLNFPPLEKQLDEVGATVVLCQFGQMESIAADSAVPGRVGGPPAGAGVSPARTSESGKTAGSHSEDRSGRMPEPAGGTPTLPETSRRDAAIAEFIAAYEKLIARDSGGGKRRMVLIEPTPIETSDARSTTIRTALSDWFPDSARINVRRVSLMDLDSVPWTFKRDGVHLDEQGHMMLATRILIRLTGHREFDSREDQEPLRQLIIAKNRLWFDYWRVQNWAFLAGDRTGQPSSRDHLDPTKRWFPAEREKFLPLIEEKEREIDALAAQLAKP